MLSDFGANLLISAQYLLLSWRLLFAVLISHLQLRLLLLFRVYVKKSKCKSVLSYARFWTFFLVAGFVGRQNFHPLVCEACFYLWEILRLSCMYSMFKINAHILSDVRDWSRSCSLYSEVSFESLSCHRSQYVFSFLTVSHCFTSPSFLFHTTPKSLDNVVTLWCGSCLCKRCCTVEQCTTTLVSAKPVC